jgi:putative FmdB family regulatory protein
MPTYTYKSVCGSTMVVTHSINEDPKLVCSNCAGAMTRAIEVPVVQFKGSGFYSTDNK